MTASWPRSGRFALRFRVDDLLPSPKRLPGLRAVFIGESPHRDEVAPESADERSPFRGVAGREWWTELARFTQSPAEMRPVPPRERLLRICDELAIAVMNAVQFPIDPKITLHQGEASDPFPQLGFEKGKGERSYRAVFKEGGKGNAVERAIADLAGRLSQLRNTPAQLVCLGGDSRWFVEQALKRLDPEAPLLAKPLLTIPHPSSWWRNAGYRTRAVQALDGLLARTPGGQHAGRSASARA